MAYTQTALGTAGYPQVAPAVATAATDDGVLTAASIYAWQVVRIISGTGVAGDLVLLERV
ncbi:hypothetical protein D3C85_1725350 [compost metagenome]